MCKYCRGNVLVNMINELGICRCGNPYEIYELLHTILKNISKYGVDVEGTVYYDYVIYQLNDKGFLEHGLSIYNSYLTAKGKKLMEALDEMQKYDYDYEDFYNNNLDTIG